MMGGVDEFSQGGRAPAGWYGDPSGQYTWRWWTGHEWSDYVAPIPAHPPYGHTSTQQSAAVLQGSQARLDRFVSIAVWIWVAFGIVGVFAAWASAGYYRSMWHWFHAFFHAVSLQQPTPAQPAQPWWDPLLSVVSLGIVAIEVIFLVWQHRAATVARALRYPACHSPGWGVGCWFIPIVNLWMPYQALRDCLPPGHPGSRRLLYAWLLFVVTNFVLAPAAIVALIGAPALGILLVGVSIVLRIAFGINAYGALSSIAADHRQAVVNPGTTG
jgi:hypothetical protein